MFVVMRGRRRYGFSNFVGDAVLTLFTGGLWLIWVVIRELRLNNPY